MAEILVSGLINLETTLRVDGFPIEYSPVRYPFFGVNNTISGVGYNVAKALTILGDRIHLLSLIGQDPAGSLVYQALAADKIQAEYVLAQLAHTPQSAILYESSGRRQINSDLKDIQEQPYPSELFRHVLKTSSLAALCNINFSRPFLQIARREAIPVATDVHALSDLEDEYNRDFMAAAQVLFMSHEHLPEAPEAWARRVFNRYGVEILVIGLGPQGALLCVRRDQVYERLPAAITRPVVNTIGAGDALFSGFIHFYLKNGDPYLALEKAILFASYKIGATGAADGFLDEQGLAKLVNHETSIW